MPNDRRPFPATKRYIELLDRIDDKELMFAIDESVGERLAEAESGFSGAPFVILEHMSPAGFETVRVVGWTYSEPDAHLLAEGMANAGLRIWLVDLQGTEGEPRVERYVGSGNAAWLYGRGVAATATGAGDKVTEGDR